MPFPFEKLDVYQRSLEFVEGVEALIQRLKERISFSVRDQLSRAALSIPLNISEGQGRWHLKEKKQFYWIARGSVFEAVPLIQIFYRRRLIDHATYLTFYHHLESLAKMLTNLIKSVDGLNRDRESQRSPNPSLPFDDPPIDLYINPINPRSPP